MVDRRRFLQLSAAGIGAAFASGVVLPEARAKAGFQDFYFVQLSDSHWGYKGPANPEATVTLPRAIEAVNNLPEAPDFIVFTGDLSHTTDDPVERRKRLTEVRDMIGKLKVKEVHLLPGEHDASLDGGAAFREIFGPTRYTFEHKGISFVVIDNVSDPGAQLGAEQLAWLDKTLKGIPADRPVVVFTHRPLFDLAPEWDWATRDGADAIKILEQRADLTVFYGHIHQEHHFTTGKIAHHAARSLIFPLPAVHSQELRTPLPWDPTHPGHGLGFREIDVGDGPGHFKLDEFSMERT